MSTSQDMTEQEIWQELVRFTGGNQYAAAGIMGNLKAESNLNSSNLQQSYERSLGHSDSSYTSGVDNGTYGNFVHDSAGYGLAQWTYYSRKQGLYDYAKSTGQSIGSTKMQLSYLEKELTENYSGTLNALKNAKSVKEASDIMMTQYERPANMSSSAKNTRASYGDAFYNQYNGTGAAATGLDLTGGIGDSTSAGLSDVTLEVEPDNINDICSQWQSKILSIDLSSIDVASTFSPLTNAGVATAYIPSLQTAFAQAEAMILSVSNTIKAAAEEQAGVDQQYQNQDQVYNGGGNRYYGGGGSSGKSGSGKEETATEIAVPTIPPVKVDTEVTEPPVEVKINKDFVDKISKLDDESYIKFMTVLGTIANGNLLEYISDTNLASKLKKALLDSPNLDADLKKIISEMDENEVQVTLQAILTDDTMFSDTSKNIIYEYTQSLSSETNINVLKATKDLQFFSQVDDIFNTVSTIIGKEDLQKNLLSIYDGDGTEALSTESIAFIKTTIDYLSTANNIEYEELLTNKEHENLLKTELNGLSKTLSYFRTVNTMGTEASQLLYSNVMKGRG